MDASITEITNIVGDLDTYADELDGEGWHNAANGCRYARDEIKRLRAALRLIAWRTEDAVPPFRVMSIDAMARIARDALAQSR